MQIAEPEVPSPADEAQSKKQFQVPASTATRRLSGRPQLANSPSRSSFLSHTSFDGSADSPAGASSTNATEDASQGSKHHHSRKAERVSERFLAQVAEWIEREKTKKATRKAHRRTSRRKSPSEEKPTTEAARDRASSVSSASSDVSLDRLQRILDDSMSLLGISSIPKFGPSLGRKHQRRSSKNLYALSRTASSDTEFYEGDVLVPSCDATLDNSKTLSYLGGKATADDGASMSSRKEGKEKQAWTVFKNEIIRLAHTLRLKGWRRVPLESGDMISVERLSGALTNAVYVVSPPAESALQPAEGKKTPSKVLLRIYGPQVEHLIDREIELGVLRRLARKKIGPRLLGTFSICTPYAQFVTRISNVVAVVNVRMHSVIRSLFAPLSQTDGLHLQLPRQQTKATKIREQTVDRCGQVHTRSLGFDEYVRLPACHIRKLPVQP